MSLEEYSDVVNYVKKHRGSMKNYDVVIMGITTGNERPSWIDESESLGCTWYVEIVMGDDFHRHLERIARGPP